MSSISRSNARITAIGVGGGGQKAINQLSRMEPENVRLVSIDTDTFGVYDNITAIQIDHNGEDIRGKIVDAVRDSDILFIVTSPGGITGTKIAPEIAEIAREYGIFTVAVMTELFSFEGKCRIDAARTGIDRLKASADAYTVISCDKLAMSTSCSRISLRGAYLAADLALAKTVYTGLSAIRNFLSDGWTLEKLTDMLRRSHKLCIIGAEANGNNRTKKLLEIMNRSNATIFTLSHSVRAIISITAPCDIEFDEIDELYKAIQSQFCENTDVNFCLHLDSEHDDFLKIEEIVMF